MTDYASLLQPKWTLSCWIRPSSEGLILSDPGATQGLSFRNKTWTLQIGGQERSLPGEPDQWNAIVLRKGPTGLSLRINEQAASSELQATTILSDWGSKDARFELARLQIDRRVLSDVELRSRLGSAPTD